MKAEGIMPRNQQIPGERFRLHDRVRALLAEVKATPRGPQLILSRAHRNFLRRLLENEVPEIYHGLVEIRSIAREPGHRSKVAVSALQSGVDPVGACVGMRGVRIQAIVRELNDEKIDVIEWNPDPAGYIAKALSPARVTGVYLDENARGTKTATVVVPEDQLSLAIGRDGQNARLAAKLTAWRIDIKSLPEATSDSLSKIQSDPEFAALAEAEVDIVNQIEAILVKKGEGRPVTPEEYSVLSQFVDRIERGIIDMRQSERLVELERIAKIREDIPEPAFYMPLEELAFTDRMTSLLSEAGFKTVGKLMIQMEMDSDAILSLNGIGPKAMENIENTLAELTFPEPEIEEPVEPEAEGIEEPIAEGTEVEQVKDDETEAAIAVDTPQDEVLEEAESVAEGEEEIAQVEEAVEPSKEEDEEELPSSLEEIFAVQPEGYDVDLSSTEFEEEEDEATARKKKKEKKKKYVEMEYDPEQDVVIVKRKRKRDEQDWESDMDY